MWSSSFIQIDNFSAPAGLSMSGYVNFTQLSEQDNDLSEFDESHEIIESLVDEYKACESPDYIKWGMEVRWQTEVTHEFVVKHELYTNHAFPLCRRIQTPLCQEKQVYLEHWMQNSLCRTCKLPNGSNLYSNLFFPLYKHILKHEKTIILTTWVRLQFYMFFIDSAYT